jgi:quercetin dioxygenase-like cupin family protein
MDRKKSPMTVAWYILAGIVRWRSRAVLIGMYFPAIILGCQSKRKTMSLPNSAGAAGKLARLGEGKVLMVLGMPHFVRLESNQNVTGASLMEVVVAPGQGVPPHTHTREDEVFCVVQGELTCQMEGLPAPVKLKTGDSVFLPRNRAHGFTNASTKEARILVTVMPGTESDRMFAELDAACRKWTDPKQLMPELGRIGETYGIRFAH